MTLDAATPPVMYGIPNCDTVKKARAWWQAQARALTFHDFKKHGVPPDRLDGWLAKAGWERLLNRKGATWRQLDASVRDGVTDAPSARRVMLAHPSVIKRPVVEWADGAVSVGYDPDAWAHR